MTKKTCHKVVYVSFMKKKVLISASEIIIRTISVGVCSHLGVEKTIIEKYLSKNELQSLTLDKFKKKMFLGFQKFDLDVSMTYNLFRNV